MRDATSLSSDAHHMRGSRLSAWSRSGGAFFVTCWAPGSCEDLGASAGAARHHLLRSELTFPGLTDQVFAEAAVRLAVNQREARRLIDRTRRRQDVIGPKRHAFVPKLL